MVDLETPKKRLKLFEVLTVNQSVHSRTDLRLQFNLD